MNSNTFYVCFLNKKKLLLELKIENLSEHYNTNTFEVLLDDVENAESIEDISLNSKEYLSVLMLPLCFGTEVGCIKYYAISDTHLEYCGNNVWEIPKIYLDTETLLKLNDDYDDNNNVINSIHIWNSAEKLNELVGMYVEPIDGSTCGVITSSFFVEGGDNDNNARWIATYYDGELVDTNVIATITYNADDIGDIILM